MSGPGTKPMEGTPVDAPCYATHGEGTSQPIGMIPQGLLFPIEVGGLADSLSRVLVED